MTRFSSTGQALETVAISAVLFWAIGGAVDSVAAEKTGPPTQAGLIPLGDAYFPAPAGTEAIELPPGGDFETGGEWPAGWTRHRAEVVEGADAPQGKAYARMPAANRSLFRLTLDDRGKPGQPHLLSFWVKSPENVWAAISFRTDARLRTFGSHYPGLPSTEGRWKRVGYYFRMPATANGIEYSVYLLHTDRPEAAICFDDVRLRTATHAEMSAAYEAERAKYPPYDVSPRPEDGKNLALSVKKWRGEGIPTKPFLIWAVGSSWTNFQGDGYPLIRMIRERFPDAPPIIYKKHAGSGTPWDFARGWVRQFVIPEQPDLVFTYTNGSPEGLEKMIVDLRRHTTADILVASLHFFQRSKLTQEEIEQGVVDWDAVRAICRKYNVEFVENRRELAAYMKTHDIEPPEMVGDSVHQNAHGRLRIWDNIVRHVADCQQASYAPAALERRVNAAAPPNNGPERLQRHGDWRVEGSRLTTAEAGAKLHLEFRGNRVDLIGNRAVGGGSVKVRVDGQPTDQLPVFFTNFIKPGRNNQRVLKGPGTGDVAPHAVWLGQNVVPQSWTITMISDSGDYELEGTVTGNDGRGNSLKPFTSDSGQILIDPELWRHTKIDPKTGERRYANRKGDTFSFDVYRCAAANVSFDGAAGTTFHVPLAQNLEPGIHTLEIETLDNGPVAIDSFYVFEPPGVAD